MRRNRHLVVFAKAPRLGTVKRRLAAGIGALAALRFQRETTMRLLRRVGRDPRWCCWLFVTPDRAARSAAPWSLGVPRVAQRSGDLGRRMTRPFRILPPGPVVIVGSDIPAIRPQHVEAAFRLLGRHDFVLGPARDGGYWLVGSRCRPLPGGVFRNVRWSTEHALADTRASLPAVRTVALTATLDDVDDERVYRRWRRSIAAGASPRTSDR